MKKFLLILLVLSVGFQGALLAQTRTVTGTVTGGDDGLGIPRVNVTVKGTTRGVPTDLNGKYSIEVASNETLVFSFVGYTSQEILVGTQTTIDVVLQPDFAELGEVIVIGYGQVEAKDATGAVASVKAKDFNGGVITSPEQLIQGKTAGVQITSASGEPGAGVNIRIRGTSSVRNGNNPLFVVDGIPLSGGDVSPGGLDLGSGTSSARNPLNFINPDDIASMDILKDASATAIYGSRGANGVVIITTKSGKGTEGRVDYSGSMSVSQATNTYELLGREEFLGNLERFGSDPTALDFGASTNWQDLVLRTAIAHKHDLAYSNSYDNGSYRASISYNNQEGIVETSTFERISGRLNINHSFLNDKLQLNGQLTVSRINDQAAPLSETAGFRGDVLGMAYSANPTLPGFADSQIAGIPNPLAMLKYINDNTETDRSLINLSADYDFTDNLNFRVNVGFDNSSSSRGQAYSGALNAGQGGVFGNGRAGYVELENSSRLLEAFFNYEEEIGQGVFSAVAGYSYQEFNSSGSTVIGWGFGTENGNQMINDLRNSTNLIRGNIPGQYQQFGFDNGQFFINQLFPNPGRIDLAERPTTSVTSVAENTFDNTDELQSFFGRVNYTLKDKYLFTATLRADGSTRFGGNNKYGYFPSAAFAWRLSDEDFIPESFSNLKLRLGYGVTGNQEIPHNLHQERQRFSDITINDGGEVVPGTIENVAFDNDDLKWEQTTQWNAGLDFGFLEGRLSGTIDLYRKNTTDLLIQVESAQPAPQPFTWFNIDAEVINQGVELSLNYLLVDGDDFTWDINTNIAYNDNEIQNYDGEDINTGQIRGQGLTGAFAQRISNGQPLYAYYLREFVGYDQSGNSLYGRGDDQNFLDGKSPLPIYNFGLSTNLTYKNFDLAIFLNGQFGHYLYNNSANAFFTAGSYKNGRNVTRETIFTGEGALNNPDVSTRFLEKGDFLRLQSLTFGYNVDIVSDSFLNSLRIYVNAQNLFVITDYTGLDPEANTNAGIDGVPSLGVDFTSFPRPRTFTIGLNASF